MDVRLLTNLVEDNVRYFELVKITIHTSVRKSYIIIGDKCKLLQINHILINILIKNFRHLFYYL